MDKQVTTYGTLYLIPSPIGENSHLEVLPLLVKKTIEKLTHIIIENEKATRRFIKKITPDKNQESLVLYPLNKFTTQEEIETYLNQCKLGYSMGLMSDAGCPGIADPGAIIVTKAHEIGIKVKPLVGPSSIFLAMMSSGMNGQNFAFNGYIPIEKKQRTQMLLKYEKKSIRENQAQLFIETPYRSDTLFKDILKTLNPNMRLCIACDISSSSEYIKTLNIHEWKGEKPDLKKRPCIFIIEGSS